MSNDNRSELNPRQRALVRVAVEARIEALSSDRQHARPDHLAEVAELRALVAGWDAMDAEAEADVMADVMADAD